MLPDTVTSKVEVTEKTEVIEEIDVGDGADPPYQLDPGIIFLSLPDVTEL